MASPYDRIFADIRKDLPSLADATLRQELFRVMDDFTQMTNIWQEEVALAILPNVKTYELTISRGKVNRLLLVYDPASQTRSWVQSGITMRVPGIVQLFQNPTSGVTWSAIVAKRTADPVDQQTKYPVIDEWIVDKYADTIGRGVLARLQFEPQKPYSNPMLASVNQRAYVAGCGLARANDGHANIFDGQNWRYPGGWGSIQRRAWA